jgi:hypothetical protein
VQGGVFATKLQFPHFDSWLRNEHGRPAMVKSIPESEKLAVASQMLRL